MFHPQFKPVLATILLFLFLSGCLQNSSPSTSSYNGSLCIRLSLAEQKSMSDKATATEIRTIAVNMTLDKTEITKKTDPVAFNGNKQEIRIEDIYPGKWHVILNCSNDAGKVIFAGQGDVLIVSGSPATINLNIIPAPGNLQISLNAAKISGFNSSMTGTVYVYAEGQGSAYATKTLTAEGTFLKGTVELPEGTYQTKVAVPNVSNAVFLSPFYTIDIHTGETFTLNIAPDGSLIVSGVIDSPPAVPTELKADYLDKPGGKIAVHWKQGTDSDLKGYYLYRTNSDGKMAWLAEIAKDVVSYTDTVTASYFYNNKIGYAVSSIDLGGNESFWSSPYYLDK